MHMASSVSYSAMLLSDSAGGSIIEAVTDILLG